MTYLNFSHITLATLSFCALAACQTVATQAATTAAAPVVTKTSPESVTVASKAVTPPPTTTAAAKAAEDGSRKICKSTKVVGSNFRKKVCATADEWKSRTTRDRYTTDNIQRKGGAPGLGN